MKVNELFKPLELTQDDEKDFQDIRQKMQQKYPGGYTVIAQWGKTRTLLTYYNYLKEYEKNPEIASDFDPGAMGDPLEYSKVMSYFYFAHWRMLKKLGVTDIITTLYHFEAWKSRGPEYVEAMFMTLSNLLSDFMLKFYDEGYTPYFIGLDQILDFYKPQDKIHSLAKKIQEFQSNFKHKEGNVYFGLELFPVNNYTYTKELQNMQQHGQLEDFVEDLTSSSDPIALEDKLYETRIKKLCNGRILPIDSSIIGTNFNGDLHIRSTLSAELNYRKRCRLFYYSGPSLLMGKDLYKKIFTDIASEKKAAMRSTKLDYAGQIDISELHKRVVNSLQNGQSPDTVTGLIR